MVPDLHINKQTHTHTKPQTGPITIHCAAKLSAQCKKNFFRSQQNWWSPNAGLRQYSGSEFHTSGSAEAKTRDPKYQTIRREDAGSVVVMTALQERAENFSLGAAGPKGRKLSRRPRAGVRFLGGGSKPEVRGFPLFSALSIWPLLTL